MAPLATDRSPVAPAQNTVAEPALTENARKVLEARYLKKNEAGECIEQPATLFRRVARTIAEVETRYGTNALERQRWEDRFYEVMTSGRFMPNSPTLMNAGRELGMLSACFVLPVRDSISEIFDSIKHTALIQKAGGGTGFAFDELRPTGDFIQSSGGTTSGPISFWRAFSEATNAIQQGAFRRGANMGMMYVHHPDILKFLHAKQDLEQFTNYNISVKVTDVWMSEFLEEPDSPQIVRNPRSGKAYVIPRDYDIWKHDLRNLIEIECVDAVTPRSRACYYTAPRLTGDLPPELAGKIYTKRDIWNIIVNNAWKTGEPGVVFIDRINEHNPTPHVGRMESTNPCGEQPLLPYEACNLGSVNLGLFIESPCTDEAEVDWDGLERAIHVATRFLDNVIDANKYPLPEIDHMCKANRKIGVGLMGFADALFKLGVAYNSDDGVAWGERFMKFLNDKAHDYSEQLAKQRGCFPNWQGSTWQTKHNRLMRNACTTTVAPTGTISIIANCSGGIEPMFSLAFLRNVLRGQKQGEQPLLEVNDTFREVAADRGILTDELLERIAREGTLAHLDEVPDDLKRVFVCAHDIAPEWHMKMQAAFQRHCDSSISKTINFPAAATPQDVEQIYRLAFNLNCKGVTVYRDGCRDFQPMALKKEKEGTQAPRHPGTQGSAGTKGGAGVLPAEECFETSPAVNTRMPADPAAGRRTPEISTSRIDAPIHQTIEPLDLPTIVSGLRIRQMTPFGNMHVKITVDPHSDRELEVFAQLGKGGDVATSDLEGICRIVSLWLRAGGSLKHVIKQLDGIGSSLQIPTRMGRITSLPDGLACALKKYQRAKERFGLRALLLGEIDPALVENPPPPPPHDRELAFDQPVGDQGGTPGKGNGNGNGAGDQGNGPGHGNERRETTEARSQGGALGSVGVPPATVAPGVSPAVGGAGVSPMNTAASPIHIAPDLRASREGEAPAEPPIAPIAAAPRPASPPAGLTLTALPAQTSAAALDDLLATIRHAHDSASHYVLKCPQCASPLAQQEGCQKCLGCGWSAC